MIAARFSLVVAASLLLAVGCATAAFAQPKEAVGAHRVLETPHFRISYATGEVFAEKRGELFEGFYRKFTEFFAAKGFPFDRKAGRMNVLLLATRRDFQDHARGVSLHLVGAEGYYSPKRRRAVFFNALEDAEYTKLVREIAAAERNLQQLRTQLARIRSNEVIVDYGGGRTKTMSKTQFRSIIAKEDRNLQSLRTRLRGHYDRSNESTTLHECAHQLVHALGIAPMEDDTPRWLNEGLGTFFERAMVGDLRQPTTVNHERLVEYRQADRVRRLIPLETFIASDRHFGGDSVLIAYAESWALIHYLLHERPEQLQRYIGLLKERGDAASEKLSDSLVADSPIADSRVADFKEAFGSDLPAFETAWTAYMAEIR
jgi:hypothetical protein